MLGFIDLTKSEDLTRFDDGVKLAMQQWSMLKKVIPMLNLKTIANLYENSPILFR